MACSREIVNKRKAQAYSRSRHHQLLLRHLPIAPASCIIEESEGASPMSIYTDNGYADRAEYLQELRLEYGSLVDILTGVLPASEDFDGLISELEDCAEQYTDLMQEVA